MFCRVVATSSRYLTLSSARNAPRVAVVGSGPAGLFTCATLLRRVPSCVIDVFDAAPVPFGLVRYGVAPDHQEVKNCIHGFEKIFNDHPNQANLFCNVNIGRDVKLQELFDNYDAVLLAYGAHRPRRLKIPGYDAKNVISGSDFVSWYNGVPDTQAPKLDGKNAVIIGNGNVALDCARMISSSDNLQTTDIPKEPLEILSKSQLSKITIAGRRGPQNVSFTIKELREQFKVSTWSSFVSLRDSELEDLQKALASGDRRKKRLFQVMLDNLASPAKTRQTKECNFVFNHVPVSVEKNNENFVQSVRFNDQIAQKEVSYPCDLLIYSIGYENIILDGLPVNENGSLKLLDECRVDVSSAAVFACGWCSHGPRGVIVDTQQQSVAVAQRIAEILPSNLETKPGVSSLLESRGIRYISWKEWCSIDEEERRAGHEMGKIREKILHFEPILSRK
ncbi:unnamed protein product, partial [Mesorhabditis belari]|uniref:NADPH:adrenodoxin oxidoreductase, mitochondrial n=1 Tax=Mesorhabditis belari TaxID=2138241 RepID=A0AAF3FBX8_9BILA